MFPLSVGSTATRFLLFCAAVALALTGVARAQDIQQPPAYIAVVEGSATIDRQGDLVAAVANMPLVVGDRLRTTNGRVEIRFPDGSGIEVTEESEIEMESATRVRVLAGAIDHLEPQPVTAQSTQYLPQDLRVYSPTFDQYGSWQYAPEYGYVWYPRVAADWRPYYNGYWEPVPLYGWTWIGVDRWAWPTHHYGRWGYARNAWFWIPGRSFAAAWVTWGYADSYVSWCPLGFDNRPVFALSIGFGDSWRGWTVVRRDAFGYRGRYANRYALSPRDIPRRTAFITQRTAPVTPRYSDFRGTRRSDAAQSPGSGAAVPRYGNRSALPPSSADRAPVAPRAERRGYSPQSSSPALARPVVPPQQQQRVQPRSVYPPQQATPRSETRPVYPQAVPRSSSPVAPRAIPRESWPRAIPRESAPGPAPRAVYPRSAPPAAAPPVRAPVAPRAVPRASEPAPRAVAPRAAAPPSAAPRAVPAPAPPAQAAPPPRAVPRSGGAESGGERRGGGRRRG